MLRDVEPQQRDNIAHEERKKWGQQELGAKRWLE